MLIDRREGTVGGYGSTRWNLEYVRTPTDPLLALDVRWLQRMGALAPGAVFRPHWTCRGEPTGWIVTICDPVHDSLMLDYKIRALGQAWEPVREGIELERTPCHYGGERIWFRCPGCRSRRAVLFSMDGHFRCRACHRLAYSSTREDSSDRSRRRLAVLRTKLGGGYAAPVWTIPPRPPGMHHRTYARQVGRIMRDIAIHDDLTDAVLDRIVHRNRYTHCNAA